MSLKYEISTELSFNVSFWERKLQTICFISVLAPHEVFFFGIQTEAVEVRFF